MHWASIPELAAVGVATVALGVVVHELSHAVVLRLAGVHCRLEFLPDADQSQPTRGGWLGRLATVRPAAVPERIAAWRLRAAAMAPLCLLAPIGLVAVGVLPDPFAGGDASLQLATIAWLGCALPSPSDFSILWYPERSLEAALQGSVSGG